MLEDALGGGARRRFVGNVELVEPLAVEMGEAGGEALARGRLELDLDGPVFAWLERLDLGFALADEAERHRLDAARRATAPQLAPQHRPPGESHHGVQGTPGPISAHQPAA